MGILNKYTQIPDHKPYHFNLEKAVMIIGSIIAGIFIVFLFFSCNPYKKILTRSPKTTSDTAAILKIAKGVVRDKPAKLIPGKTIIKKVPVGKIIKVLDSALISKLSDSLINASINQADNYNNNIDAVINDCNKAVKKALQKGYSQALDSISTLTYTEHTPDTISVADNETLIDLTACQVSLRTSNAALIKVTAERDIYKKQANKFWLWLIIGLVVGGGVVKIISVLKPKIPTA